MLHSEAVRKLLSGLGMAEFRLSSRSELAEHQVQMADLDHSRGRFGGALIVLAVPPRTAFVCSTTQRLGTGVKPLLQGTGLYFDAPLLGFLVEC